MNAQDRVISNGNNGNNEDGLCKLEEQLQSIWKVYIKYHGGSDYNKYVKVQMFLMGMYCAYLFVGEEELAKTCDFLADFCLKRSIE